MYILTQNREIINPDSYLNSNICKGLWGLDKSKKNLYAVCIRYYDNANSYFNTFIMAEYSSKKVCSKVFEDFWNTIKSGTNYFEFPADNPEGEE